MVNVLILVIVLVGFFLTYVLIISIHFFSKKSVCNTNPPQDDSEPRIVKLQWPDQALEIKLKDVEMPKPEPRSGLSTILRRRDQNDLNANLVLDQRELNANDIRRIGTAGLIIAQDDPPIPTKPFQLVINTGPTGGEYTFSIPTTPKLSLAQIENFIVIVEDIMNRNDIETVYELRDLTENHILAVNYESGENKLTIRMLPKPMGFAACGADGTKQFDVKDSQGRLLDIEITNSGGTYTLTASSITDSESFSIQDNTVLLNVFDSANKICIREIS